MPVHKKSAPRPSRFSQLRGRFLAVVVLQFTARCSQHRSIDRRQGRSLPGPPRPVRKRRKRHPGRYLLGAGGFSATYTESVSSTECGRMASFWPSPGELGILWIIHRQGSRKIRPAPLDPGPRGEHQHCQIKAAPKHPGINVGFDARPGITI